jgi:hypothetical protein
MAVRRVRRDIPPSHVPSTVKFLAANRPEDAVSAVIWLQYL